MIYLHRIFLPGRFDLHGNRIQYLIKYFRGLKLVFSDHRGYHAFQAVGVNYDDRLADPYAGQDTNFPCRPRYQNPGRSIRMRDDHRN